MKKEIQQFFGPANPASLSLAPSHHKPLHHQRDTHLEDLHDDPLVVGDVDGLKDLAVLPSAELSNQLVVVLVAAGTKRREAVVGEEWITNRAAGRGAGSPPSPPGQPSTGAGDQETLPTG